MFGPKRTIWDRNRLAREVNQALDQVLSPDEWVRVIIPGANGSVLVGSETRGFIWKKKHLSVYPYENLTTVAFGDGLALKWVQFRGPSIGLVKPTLSNVADLLDAVRVEGGIDKAARAELERFVAVNARSVPGFAPGTVVAGAAMMRDSNMPGSEIPLMEAEGVGGHLWLFEHKVRIKHHGMRGALSTGVIKGDKEIALAQISAVQWRDPGNWWLGHIQFSFMGGSSDARMASKDENAVMFRKGQEPAFRAVKEEIDKRLLARYAPAADCRHYRCWAEHPRTDQAVGRVARRWHLDRRRVRDKESGAARASLGSTHGKASALAADYRRGGPRLPYPEPRP